MKKILSIKYSTTVFNITFLLLRVVFGAAMLVNHGYGKLVHFADRKDRFVDLFGIGSPATLSLVIFAEFFCAIFIILGLFTRLAAIPLVIAMGYAFFISNSGNLFGDGESSALFLTVFLAILLCGPGRVSVDGMINK